VLLGQTLETAVIIHLPPHLGGLFGRDALIELFSPEKALEDEVRAAPLFLAGGGLEELLAQAPAAQVVNGLKALEDEVSFLAQGIDGRWHRAKCLYTHAKAKAKTGAITLFLIPGHFAVTHPIDRNHAARPPPPLCPIRRIRPLLPNCIVKA
jgi:hypothetical protein